LQKGNKINRYHQHQKRLKEILLGLQKAFPSARFFERHVGLFLTINQTPIRINKPGMADVWGLIPHNGQLIHVEIEVKTGNAKQSRDQKKWEKFINNLDGIYIIARSVEQTVAELRFQIYGTPKRLQ
jgi:hypothetical protein